MMRTRSDVLVGVDIGDVVGDGAGVSVGDGLGADGAGLDPLGAG